MERSLLIPICAVVAIVIAALSLGQSFAHALEAPPRLKVWSPELWHETTVFNGQFRLFLAVGAPLDMAAILAPAIMAFVVRDDPRSCLLFVAFAGFYAVALAL
jgi:hypothetical protein